MASLSAGLLARKGHARPAMRRADTLAALAGAGDDLGWNDMGDTVPAPPAVLAVREQLAAALAAPAARGGPALPRGKRTAFTLRLDGERHARLRGAAAARGISAQTLLSEAIDALAAANGDRDRDREGSRAA